MRPVRFILFPLLAILAIGCAQLKPQSEVATEEDAESGIFPSEAVSPPPVFPHSDEWKEATSHGVWAEQYGREVCLQCHQVRDDGTATFPTCNSCHPQFPHEEGWALPEGHGKWVVQNGTDSCSGQCHGADLGGGLSRISCNDCHEVYPHPSGWREPPAHGEFARTEGEPLCRSCHGEDLRGGISGVSCYQCHTIYPHKEDWGKPENHGAQVTAYGKLSCATQCHGTDLQGGLTGISCQNCHEIYPHPSGWDEGIRHGPAALAGIETCKSCHGAGLDRSPTGGPTCQGCHASFLRHPQAAVGTADSDWGSPEGHGRYFLDLPDQNETSECRLCHGEDLRGGISNKSCYSCHSPFPHPAGWGDPIGEESHTGFVLAKGFSPCRTSCHGADFNGGLSGVSCGAAGCHQNFPHADSWKKRGKHDQVFVQQLAGGEERPCLGCHGDDYLGGPSGVACNRCHRLSHIPGKWAASFQHGSAWRKDQTEGHDKCSRCHDRPIGFNDAYSGVEPAGDGEAPRCYECHPAFPHISYRTEETYNWEAPGGAAHLRFIMRNRRLLTGSSLDDPALVDSIRETCGNGGGCHTDGRFSHERDNTSAACSDVCHLP